MNKIYKILGAVVGLGAAAWAARDVVMRRPAPVGGLSSLPAVTAIPAPHRQPADDLTRIRGIGKAYATRLTLLGIDSFLGLAEADPDSLSNALGLKSRTDVTDWIQQAKDLA